MLAGGEVVAQGRSSSSGEEVAQGEKWWFWKKDSPTGRQMTEHRRANVE